MIQLIIANTLIDITNTNKGQVRYSNSIEYHQQQNLNVLLQTISLRTQPMEPLVTKHLDYPMVNQFGTFFGVEPQTIWRLEFYIENPGIWRNEKSELGFLEEDIYGVAFTSDLDNSVEFPVNIFDPFDNVNIRFYSQMMD